LQGTWTLLRRTGRAGLARHSVGAGRTKRLSWVVGGVELLENRFDGVRAITMRRGREALVYRGLRSLLIGLIVCASSSPAKGRLDRIISVTSMPNNKNGLCFAGAPAGKL
jgi:hypothetical protein